MRLNVGSTSVPMGGSRTTWLLRLQPSAHTTRHKFTAHLSVRQHLSNARAGRGGERACSVEREGGEEGVRQAVACHVSEDEVVTHELKPGRSIMHTWIHGHTHTRAHTHTQTHTHTHAHAHARTCTQTHIHTHVCSLGCTHTHTRSFRHVQKHCRCLAAKPWHTLQRIANGSFPSQHPSNC